MVLVDALEALPKGGVLYVKHLWRRISSDKEQAMKKALVPLLISALWLGACGQGDQGTGSSQADQGVIRVALGDIESVETLNLFIALEHVRERGVEVETTELADEDLANQAVVSGKSDVALGAPYGLIEGTSAPLRIFCQLQTLRYFPVVDKAAYPDWQALDGEPLRCTRVAQAPRHLPGSSSKKRASSSARSVTCPARRYARMRCCAETSRPPCSTFRTRTT